VEIESGPIGEGFEPEKLERLQMHVVVDFSASSLNIES
jgi:hypothetical protein